MNYKFKLLRDLGAKIENRDINDEDAVKLAEELDASLAGALDEHTGALKEEIKALIEEKINAALTGATEANEETKKEVEEVTEEVRKALAELQRRDARRTNIRKAVRAAVDRNYNELRDAIKAGRQFEFQIEMRDPAMMTTANFGYTLGSGSNTVSLAPGTVFSDEIHELRYPENFIIDVIGGRRVQYVNDLVERGVNNEEGAAQVVAEGGLKPMISFETDTKHYTKRKIAGYIQYTDELRDAEGERLYNLILDLLERKVLRDYQALTLAWLEANASTYLGENALSGTMVEPTNVAAFEAAALQLAALGYTPDVIYYNPADMAADKFKQNAGGSFIGNDMPDLLPMRHYASYAVPRGKFFVLDSSMIREEHTDVFLKFGRVNAQLLHNEETAVAELYQLIHFVNGENQSAIVGNLETIKADLKKAATPAA